MNEKVNFHILKYWEYFALRSKFYLYDIFNFTTMTFTYLFYLKNFLTNM